MKYFAMLIKPSSSKCNLRCRYCFYSNVSNHRDIKDYGIMKESTVDNIIKNVFDTFDEESTITFSFQGGEPTIAGLKYFKYFIDCVNSRKKNFHKINYTIQTNGTLINDEWINIFRENNFLVGISLDGFKRNHDSLRIDINEKGTFNKVMDNIEKLENNKIEYNVLIVLTSKLSKYPNELFAFIKKNNFRYIQLIPCLPPLDDNHDEYSLKPIDFFKFYDVFFKLWYKEFINHNYISVTLFDNLIPMFNNIPPQQCGYLGFCSMQFVLESDGSVYPCDFYVLDKYKVGNINEDSIIDLAKSKLAKEFVNEERELCTLCSTCKYIGICNGQCKRLSVCYYDKDYCGYQKFIEENEKLLIDVARRIR